MAAAEGADTVSGRGGVKVAEGASKGSGAVYLALDLVQRLLLARPHQLRNLGLRTVEGWWENDEIQWKINEIIAKVWVMDV